MNILQRGLSIGWMILAGALVSCGTSPAPAPAEESVYPPTIQNWLNANQDEYYVGRGIAPIDGNESFALREVTTLALADLTRELETQVATLSTNIQQKEGAAKAAKVSEGTKQQASNVISGAKTLGPVKANGNFYALKYIKKEDFRNPVLETLKQAQIQITEDELDILLNSK
ncbi:MAG: hypothetical protein LBO65_09235 [Spirochaetaceae bacterium]|jgi:hypothetical protein|nr:hypothetical protein [Spirochaetaceae bacterium]